MPARDITTGRVPELWRDPRRRGPALGLEVPAAWRRDLVSGATLAISLEPPGGSPAAGPTGPVVAHGAIAAV